MSLPFFVGVHIVSALDSCVTYLIPYRQFYMVHVHVSILFSLLHCICRSSLFPVFTFSPCNWIVTYLNCPIVDA